MGISKRARYKESSTNREKPDRAPNKKSSRRWAGTESTNKGGRYVAAPIGACQTNEQSESTEIREEIGARGRQSHGKRRTNG